MFVPPGQTDQTKKLSQKNRSNDFQSLIQKTEIPKPTRSLFRAEDLVESEDSETNQTGIPTPLKAHFEAVSGYRLDDVRVHTSRRSPRSCKRTRIH